MQVAVGIDPHQIVGRIEPVRREHVAPVDLVETRHERAATQVQLADLTRSHLCAGLRVDDPSFDAVDGATGRAPLVVGHAPVDRLGAVSREGLRHPEQVGPEAGRDELAVLVAWRRTRAPDPVDVDAARDRRGAELGQRLPDDDVGHVVTFDHSSAHVTTHSSVQAVSYWTFFRHGPTAALVGSNDAMPLSRMVFQLLITLVKVSIFVAVMLIVGRRVIPWLMHYTAHTGSRELFRLAVYAIDGGEQRGSRRVRCVGAVEELVDGSSPGQPLGVIEPDGPQVRCTQEPQRAGPVVAQLGERRGEVGGEVAAQ